MEKEEILPYASYTTKEAAELLNINHQTLQRYIKAGKLEASQLGKRYRITGETILKFLGIEPSVYTSRTPERTFLIQDLGEAIEELYKTQRKKSKGVEQYNMGVFLHQRITLYADEKTLRKILSDVRHQIRYLKEKNST